MATEVIDQFEGAYAFLSNFYKMQENRTVEHYFQACKTSVPEERAWVLDAPTPGEAKRRGRKVTLRHDWDDIRIDVMRCLVAFKFFSDPELAQKLTATGDAILYEGNTWNDRYWGIDLVAYRTRGKVFGQNELGQILMEIREQLPERSKYMLKYMSEFEALTQPEVLDV